MPPIVQETFPEGLLRAPHAAEAGFLCALWDEDRHLISVLQRGLMITDITEGPASCQNLLLSSLLLFSLCIAKP